MHCAICERQNWRCMFCKHCMPVSEKQAHLDAVLRVDSVFAAVMEGSVEVLKTFLEHDGSPNTINSLSDSLLHTAARSGKVAVTKLLLEHKADTAVTNAMLDNPLQVAMKHHQKDVLLILMKHNKKLKKERAKKAANQPSAAAWRAPLQEVTNTARGAGSSSGGVTKGAPPPPHIFSGTTRMCGPAEDICGICGEVVPSTNLALHELRCQRHSFRCPHCSQLLPASEREAHLDTSEARIIAAVTTSDVPALESLLQHGADIAGARDTGNSMLHLAVARKDVCC